MKSRLKMTRSAVLCAWLFLLACAQDPITSQKPKLDRNNSSTQRLGLLTSRIDSIEIVLARDSLVVKDQDMALNSLGSVCVDLANGYPKSGYAPVALWKASRAFRAAGSYAEAIECGRALVDAYPEHDLAASALFHNALIFNDDLNNAASARFYLERLLEEYPSDSLAPQAKAMKELVGLNDKELLKKIRRRE